MLRIRAAGGGLSGVARVARLPRMSPANLFILGAPRSGTSLMAGLFSEAGFFQGENFLPADGNNLHGYFESLDILDVNEALLKPLVRRLPIRVWEFLKGRGWEGALRPVFPWLTPYGKRFLSHFPSDMKIPGPAPELKERMRGFVLRRPFCLKDPRFSYTFALWRELAPESRLVCLVRDPYVTARSMIGFGWPLSPRAALRSWECIYRFILANRDEDDPDWLFVHYDQILSGEAFDRLEAFAGVGLKRGFVDAKSNRSRALDTKGEASVDELYGRLCALADYRVECG